MRLGKAPGRVPAWDGPRCSGPERGTGGVGAPRAAGDGSGISPPSEVLRQFAADPDLIELVSAKPDKPVWRVVTPDGPAYLKRMTSKRSRVLFAMGAAAHLHAQGVDVARPFRTRDGGLLAQDGAACYALFAPLTGEAPVYARDLDALAAALARFHTGSSGYVPPPGSHRRDHLDDWPPAYDRAQAALRACTALAAALGAAPDRFSEEAPLLARSAAQARQRLEAAIGPAAAAAREAPLLCHQDFAASNLRITGGTVSIFDMDGVAFDLPVRDLRKLLVKVAKVAGGWSATTMARAITAYEGERPLSEPERAVLFADLEFPHLAVSAARKLLLKPPLEWGPEEALRRLDATLALEASKRAALTELAADWGRTG